MSTIGRREFLGTALAGTAGLLLGDRLAVAAEANTDPTGVVPLGKSLKVCRMGLGTGMRGGNRQSNHTRMGEARLTALVNHCYDQNIRLFDCADLYGTHPYVGRILKGKPRDSYYLVSKMWVLRGGIPERERPDADMVVKRFLTELQTEYIDLVQIHCMSSPKWPEDMRKQMDIMEKLKEQGLIRAHGVSCHSLEALKAAAAEPWVDVIHARINPRKAAMDGPVDDVVPVVKKAHEAGKGIIGMKLMGEGRFTPEQKAESIRWVMGLGCVDVLIAGCENPQQVDEFKGLVHKRLVAMARRRPREAALV
jgi:aryl-alcohol dehydrogenase-like predicted oxidoreductase